MTIQPKYYNKVHLFQLLVMNIVFCRWLSNETFIHGHSCDI